MWLLVLLPYPGTADQPPTLPVALQAMQQPEHVTELQVPMAARVAWLNCQYTHFHQHPGKGELLRKLQKLRKIIGGKVRRGARPARHCSQLDASPCQVCIISFLHGALARHRCITGCLLWVLDAHLQMQSQQMEGPYLSQSRAPIELASITISSRLWRPAVCASRRLPSNHCSAAQGHICFALLPICIVKVLIRLLCVVCCRLLNLT